MSSSKPKSVFVTGASAGIGYALSIEFAKKGYKVFAGARRLEKLKKLEEYGITIVEFDILNTESINRAKNLISKETDGELDILFNNVGIAPSKNSIFDQDIKELRQGFETNYFGHVEVIQIFQTLILKSKGLVAFTDSVIDLSPAPFTGAYAASKAAFHQLGESLALEVNPLGVKVVQVRTGRVESEIGGTEETPKPSKDSIYYLDEDTNILYADFGDGQKADVYAKNVISDIEKVIRSKSTFYKVVYRGDKASTVGWISWLLPFSVWISNIISFLKLKEPFARVKAKLDHPKSS
ncbi:Dehydrogenase/reductase SDR family member 9 [Wickerhamomyces ciferrii]|uniref:Dehydrogenase/reductase SDR family member 9 n=1 Tax=Wickerhamomyces ciferrii (strain ATCC 14091 / BCRC 22168 / CBS 111 / JCM 3599 / NBRC 0793 / NRRL Y-1031 F-60-10) TaxID=1206466 RepID=K0KDR5_WICCF|nr:Dehydrogenase/reductase SDR family member 9 [Wickerhamomyces ciferrii]CCH41066.1 Dehydrogenase/reductase SDR family member 9 [Wickerhamomyces ciferrii]